MQKGVPIGMARCNPPSRPRSSFRREGCPPNEPGSAYWACLAKKKTRSPTVKVERPMRLATEVHGSYAFASGVSSALAASAMASRPPRTVMASHAQ
jgi:hypothetical protein